MNSSRITEISRETFGGLSNSLKRLHLEDNRLNTEQQMIDFLGKHGIDTDKFIEKYNNHLVKCIL